MQHDPASFAPHVRVMQIIVFALTMGCTSVLVVMYVLRNANAPRPQTPLLTYLGLAFCGSVVLARIFLPGLLANEARKKIAPSDAGAVEALVRIYQVRMIIGAALLEGAVFFLAVAYLQEGHPLALGVGAALTLAVAAHFPTTAGVAAWVNDQQERMRLERLG